MAKPLPTRELEAILHLMQALEDCASIAQIHDRLTPRPHRRSLQRWLAQLIVQGHLHKKGMGPGTQYFLGRLVAMEPVHLTARAGITARPSVEFPLSEEAQTIAAYIAQPLHQRTPVGYNPDFLDSYRPNTTFYLPESTRASLLAAG